MVVRQNWNKRPGSFLHYQCYGLWNCQTVDSGGLESSFLISPHIFSGDWVVICRAWSYLEATHWPSKCQTYLFCNSSNHHWAMSNISNDSMTVQLFRLAGFRRTIFRLQIFVRRLSSMHLFVCAFLSPRIIFIRTFSAVRLVQTKNAGQKNTQTKNAPN